MEVFRIVSRGEDDGSARNSCLMRSDKVVKWDEMKLLTDCLCRTKGYGARARGRDQSVCWSR